MPEGWKLNSPQLVRRGKRWYLHVSITRIDFKFPGNVETQLAKQNTRLCVVDLNINDSLAVCTIQRTDGTVVATRFLRGGRALHGRRKRALGWVAVKRSQTGALQDGIADNTPLFRYIRALDQDCAHRVSRRIVEFAQRYGATILVFEHLGHFKVERGKYSKRGNEKRTYWLRGKIFHYTRYKAWEQSILTSRVNPRDTSRLSACCHELVARYGANELATGYCEGAPLFQCSQCLKRGNADRNASTNIGHRLLQRYDCPYFPKPAAKVAGVSVSHGIFSEQGKSLRETRPNSDGERDGSGTTQHIPRSLRTQWSSGYAASTPSAA